MDRQTFAELRQLASRKRDQAILAAREDYKKSIAEIARLEHHLIGEIKAQRPASKTKMGLQELICSILPGDRTFTIDDVCGLIKAADPERKFARGTVRTVLNRLYHENTIARVNDACGARVTTYCLPGFEAPVVRSLADWAEIILTDATKPMKPIEIMVAMTEAGYELECSPKDAVHHLVEAMEKFETFRREGDEWSLRCRK